MALGTLPILWYLGGGASYAQLNGYLTAESIQQSIHVLPCTALTHAYADFMSEGIVKLKRILSDVSTQLDVSGLSIGQAVRWLRKGLRQVQLAHMCMRALCIMRQLQLSFPLTHHLVATQRGVSPLRDGGGYSAAVSRVRRFAQRC